MNPLDFIFPKGADEKLRVQIASMFGGMGVGDKNGMCPVKKRKLICGMRHHHHHHCNSNTILTLYMLLIKTEIRLKIF